MLDWWLNFFAFLRPRESVEVYFLLAPELYVAFCIRCVSSVIVFLKSRVLDPNSMILWIRIRFEPRKLRKICTFLLFIFKRYFFIRNSNRSGSALDPDYIYMLISPYNHSQDRVQSPTAWSRSPTPPPPLYLASTPPTHLLRQRKDTHSTFFFNVILKIIYDLHVVANVQKFSVKIHGGAGSQWIFTEYSINIVCAALNCHENFMNFRDRLKQAFKIDFI
jgi:hypothetical protein